MKSKLCLSRLSPLGKLLLLLSIFGALSGCEQISGILGVESAAHKSARLEAEGKAVGGGCRQSGRAIEDCYSIYTWVPKEAVFTGWREMDAYMRENNLETVLPLLPPAPPPPPPPPPETGKKKKKAPAPENTEGEEKREGEQAAAPRGPIPVYAPARTIPAAPSLPEHTPITASPAQTLPVEIPAAGNPAAITPAPPVGAHS